MAVEMVDVDNRYAQSERHAFGEARADKQRSQKPGPAGKCYRRQIALVYSGAFDRCVDDRHYILLVGTRREFGHNAAILLMHALRRNDVAEQKAVGNDGRRGVVARRFYSENDCS